MESDSGLKRSKRGVGRVVGGIVCLCGIGLSALWWQLARDDTAFVIPTPTLPSPNAFDYDVAAGKALVQAKQFDNIYSDKPTVVLTPAQKESIVQQNAAALLSLHQGFLYEYRNPPDRSNFTAYSHLTTFRDLAHLLKAQSRVRAARGDWGVAADSALDAIRFGEDMKRGGPMMVEMTATACQAIGQHTLWDTLEHLNAAQTRVAIARLNEILARRVPYADTLQEDSWTDQAILHELFRTVTARNALATADEWMDRSAPPSQRYATALALVFDKRGILRHYREFMEATMAQARQPYAAKLPPPPTHDFLSERMTWAYERQRFIAVKTETQSELLLVTLALHAYRLEHGHDPPALAELVPAYLKRLPDDPFALQGTFRYLPKGARHVLYSVGPDGKDDGGTPIVNLKKTGAARPEVHYYMQPENTGDMVAGVNVT